MPIVVQHDASPFLETLASFYAGQRRSRYQAKQAEQERKERERQANIDAVSGAIGNIGPAIAQQQAFARRVLLLKEQQALAIERERQRQIAQREQEWELYKQKKEAEGYAWDYSAAAQNELNQVDTDEQRIHSESQNMAPDQYVEAIDQIDQRRRRIGKTWVYRGDPPPKVEDWIQKGLITERPDQGGAWVYDTKKAGFTFLKYNPPKDEDNTADLQMKMLTERGKQAINAEYDAEELRQKREERAEKLRLDQEERKYNRYLNSLESAHKLLTKTDKLGMEIAPDEAAVERKARQLMRGPFEEENGQPAPQQPNDRAALEARAREIMSHGQATPEEIEELLQIRAALGGQ